MYDTYFSLIAGLVKQDGQPDASSQLTVNISPFNVCTSQYLPTIFAFAESLPAGDILTDKQLLTAKLHTTLTGQDVNGNSFSVAIDLTWTGIQFAPPQPSLDSRNSDHSTLSLPNVRFVDFEKLTRRESSLRARSRLTARVSFSTQDFVGVVEAVARWIGSRKAFLPSLCLMIQSLGMQLELYRRCNLLSVCRRCLSGRDGSCSIGELRTGV